MLNARCSGATPSKKTDIAEIVAQPYQKPFKGSMSKMNAAASFLCQEAAAFLIDWM